MRRPLRYLQLSYWEGFLGGVRPWPRPWPRAEPSEVPLPQVPRVLTGIEKVALEQHLAMSVALQVRALEQRDRVRARIAALEAQIAPQMAAIAKLQRELGSWCNIFDLRQAAALSGQQNMGMGGHLSEGPYSGSGILGSLLGRLDR